MVHLCGNFTLAAHCLPEKTGKVSIMGVFDWQLTVIGQKDSPLKCPYGPTAATATRLCSGNFSSGGVWKDPDVSSCKFKSERTNKLNTLAKVCKTFLNTLLFLYTGKKGVPYSTVTFVEKLLDCWFSLDVTKIQTTKLLMLPRFYFHDVLEQLKTNFHTNFGFKKVLGFVIEYAWISKLLLDAAFTWRPRQFSCRFKKWLISRNFAI